MLSAGPDATQRKLTVQQKTKSSEKDDVHATACENAEEAAGIRKACESLPIEDIDSKTVADLLKCSVYPAKRGCLSAQ